MSEPLLNSPTSNTPSSATPLQVLKEQLVVVKAKHDAKGVKASGTTKSKATPALGKENAEPVKQHRKNKAEKCEPEIKKEENDCIQ